MLPMTPTWLRTTKPSSRLQSAALMKMLAEYLETAMKFEQMAAEEKDPNYAYGK
jgi:hypothetical protein